jgi:Uma2 family endonuclease
MSIGAAHTTTRRMSGAEFRAFQETRPDHERWELIKGVPVMMVPPTLWHQFIADNLTSLLNTALAKHNRSRRAVSRSGVELGHAALAPIGEDYRPEPDVMVVDVVAAFGQRFVERAYVVAEMVSDTDHRSVPDEKEPWIAIKRRLYLAHPPCEAVILVDPSRVEIQLDLRTKEGWTAQRLTRLDEQLEIPNCGLKCLVADVYEGTAFNR